MEVVRLYIRGGMPLSEARELFADLERAHDTLVAVDALALSFVDRPKRFYRRYVEEFGPFGPFGRSGRVWRDRRASISSVVSPRGCCSRVSACRSFGLSCHLRAASM